MLQDSRLMPAISARRVRVLPPRPGPPADGVSLAVRRASDVGVGFLSLSISGGQAIFDRFLPGAVPANPHHESIARQIGRAATGIALVAESQALAACETLERLGQHAIGTARQVPVVRDVLVGIDSSMTRWAERGDAELERRQAVVTDFVAGALPALVDAVFERVDFTALAVRLPVAEIVAALDVNAILEVVDVNTILRHVDVDALLARIDLGPIVAEVLTEVDVGGIVRESTGSITNDAVDGARLTAMRLDGFVARIADRILLRGTDDRNAGLDR